MLSKMRPILKAMVGFEVLSSRRHASGFLSSEGKQWLRREIAKFDVNEKLERAKTPPPTWYLGDEFYMLDKGAIIRSNYCAVESLHRLEPGPKSFMTGSIADERYLFTRPGNNDTVKGFYNLCRHHGITLEWKDCGKSEQFPCPYHGWVFDNEGRLVKALKMRGIECFSSKNYGLEPVDVFSYWPMAFAKPARHPTTPGSSRENMEILKKTIKSLEEAIFYKPEHFVTPQNYQHVRRKIYPMKCNWKVYIDNFLDDSYHFNITHAATQGSIIDFSNFKTNCYLTDDVSGKQYQMAVLTTTYKDNPKAFVKFMHIYPNVMFQIYNVRPFLDVYYVLPTGPSTCVLISDWFVTKEYLANTPEKERDAFIEKTIAFEDKAQYEDIAVCERTFEGNKSWGFTFGRYVPAMEEAMFLFHKRLASEYLRYLDSDIV